MRMSRITPLVGVRDISPVEPLARQPPRIFNGPRPRGNPRIVHSDEVVLEARRLCKYTTMTVREVAEHFTNNGYSLTDGQVAAMIRYANRIHLEPADTKVPYWPTK